jgi:hypothetical protein
MGLKLTVIVCVALCAGAIEVRAGSAGNGSGSTPQPVYRNDSTPLPASLKLSAELVGADGTVPDHITVSPNGLHIAYITHKGSRSVAVIDGKMGPVFDAFDHITQLSDQKFAFSPDGKRCGYLGHSGDELKVVVGDEQSAAGLQIRDFMFSPDGSHYAFSMIAANNGPWVEVFDGKPQTIEYVSEPKNPTFSSDGKHFAYAGQMKEFIKESKSTVLVIDGKPSPRFSAIREFTFSSDGAHYAYIGDDREYPAGASGPTETSHLIVDGAERASFPTMAGLMLSADGAHVAFFGGKQGARTAWLDGKTWDFTNDSSEQLPAVMSPDGSKLAYLQNKNGGRRAVIVNGKKGLDYDNITDMHFSADGHLYYQAAMNNNGGAFVIRDEEEFGPYMPVPNGGEMPTLFAFSPDGKHVAYRAGDGKHAFVVADGKKGADYDFLHGKLVYSADGQHRAYLAMRNVANNLPPIERQQYLQKPGHDTGVYLVVDEKALNLPDNSFHGQTSLQFSPDGQHTLVQDQGSGLRVDGQPIKTMPHPNQSPPAVMGDAIFSPDSKHVIYQQGSQVGGADVVIDGDEAPNYHAVSGSKPVVNENGKVCYFALSPSSPTPYRVTLDMGAPRNFGISAGGGDTAVANNPQQQQQQQIQQQQQTQQQLQQQQTQHPDAVTKAQQQADKAKAAGEGLKNLFHH